VTVTFTGLDIILLKWVMDLLNKVVASAASDRLKKTKLSSTERASLLAHNLYKALKELEERSKDFVEALTALAAGESEAREALQFALERVAEASNKVAKKANEIDPARRKRVLGGASPVGVHRRGADGRVPGDRAGRTADA
jgi:hypothetical protein